MVSDDILNQQAIEGACFTDMACPTAHVSAFCRAVVAKVIPRGFWGNDGNKRTIMHYIDQFVSLRKYETLTMHQVTQNLEVCDVRVLAHFVTETL